MENKTLKELESEIEQLKNEIERYRELFSRQDRLKNVEELSVGVFHEISNPLTVLKSNLSLLKEEVDRSGKMDEKRQSLFLMAERGIDRMEQVSASLRRVIHGVGDDSLNQAPQSTDLKFLIEDTLRFVTPTFRSEGISLKHNLEKECWVSARVDRLQQVFLNLLMNARDAVKESEIKEIEFQVVTDAKQAIILVKDTGHGIKPEDRKKVFQSFYTSKSPGKGTGLGLSLAKQYVDEMNGFIDVESEEGEGACFVITLQLADEKLSENQDKNEQVYPRLTSGKLLLVHPKPEIAAVLQNSLSKQGFEVSICHEAIEARELVLSSDFDFVFVAYQLDSMNGLQFVSSLRSEASSFLVLLFDKKISSLPERTKNVILNIAHGYLERPFDDKQFGELMARIKSLNSISA